MSITEAPSSCATPDCTNTAGRGLTRRFCRRCADRLAVIRDQFEAEQPESRAYRIYGARYMLGDGERDDS